MKWFSLKLFSSFVDFEELILIVETEIDAKYQAFVESEQESDIPINQHQEFLDLIKPYFSLLKLI